MVCFVSFFGCFFGSNTMDYGVIVRPLYYCIQFTNKVPFKYKILTALVQINAVKRVFIAVSCITII